MEGREYHFVSKETFTNMAEAGAFMEYGFKGSHAFVSLAALLFPRSP
jgi:guanylate kinase